MLSILTSIQTQTMEVTDTAVAAVTETAVNTVAPQAAAALPAAAAESLSFWELCLKGGFIMIPLALLMVVSIYVFVER